MRGEQKIRFIATGQLLQYLHSNCEQFWKESWRNEVQNATLNPTQASWIHQRVALTQNSIHNLAYIFVLFLLQWQVIFLQNNFVYTGIQASEYNCMMYTSATLLSKRGPHTKSNNLHNRSCTRMGSWKRVNPHRWLALWTSKASLWLGQRSSTVTSGYLKKKIHWQYFTNCKFSEFYFSKFLAVK